MIKSVNSCEMKNQNYESKVSQGLCVINSFLWDAWKCYYINSFIFVLKLFIIKIPLCKFAVICTIKYLYPSFVSKTIHCLSMLTIYQWMAAC